LDPHERAVLQAWANGRAGASPRLSKRAWLVLAEADRSNPIAIGEAWGGSREVRDWINRFRREGLPGLIDAPRRGRPPTALDAAKSALQKARPTSHRQLLESARALPKPSREALWRHNRLTGDTLDRVHRQLDLPLQVPPALNDLVCLYADAGLIMLGRMPKADRHLDTPNGRWLHVKSSHQNGSASKDVPRDMLSALALPSHNDDPHHPVLPRFATALLRLAKTHRNRIELTTVVNLNRGMSYIEWLRHYARAGFGNTSTVEKQPVLRSNVTIAHDDRLAFAVQEALVRTFPDVKSKFLGKMLDHLRHPRALAFAWVRTPNTDLEVEADSPQMNESSYPEATYD
jgi:hypothetical protein